MPVVSIDAMNQHLAEISKCVSISAIALLILDGAGWHSSPQLILPENIVLMPLPSYAPELNSSKTYGTICAATFSATASGTPTSRSSTPVAMPGTPSWQNPRHHLNRNQKMGTGHDLRRLV